MFSCVFLTFCLCSLGQIGTIKEYPDAEIDPNLTPLQNQNKQLSFSVRTPRLIILMLSDGTNGLKVFFLSDLQLSLLITKISRLGIKIYF